MVLVYCHRGLTVTTAMVNGQFDPLCGKIGDVDLNVTVVAQHAPEIDRCIQMVKERVRSQRSRLPFSQLPACVVIGLVLLDQCLPSQKQRLPNA